MFVISLENISLDEKYVINLKSIRILPINILEYYTNLIVFENSNIKRIL